jgi:hypothetical protein
MGSHSTLRVGDYRTTIKARDKEIGEGLLKTMCEQLGISKEEIFSR